MKTLKILLAVAGLGLLAGAAKPARNTYSVAGDYKVTINGTSNLHSWDEKIGKVSGNSVVSWNSDGSFNLDAINIKMAVRSIKSDMGSVMDNNTYTALKANSYPDITFTLMGAVNAIKAGSNDKVFTASGNLTIAGVTRFVEMKVKVFVQPNGSLVFEGSQPLSMTDYKVDPPTALFGTLKTGNQISINFKISLAKVS